MGNKNPKPKKKDDGGRTFGPRPLANNRKKEKPKRTGRASSPFTKRRSGTGGNSAGGGGGGPHRGTGGSGAARAGGGSWACKHCTYVNNGNMAKCPMCYNLRGTPSGGPRPSGGGGGGRSFGPRPSGGGGGGRSFGPRPSGGGGGGRSFGPRPSGGGTGGGTGGGGGGDFLGKFHTAHLRGDAHGMPYIDPITQKTITNRLLENMQKGNDHYSWYVFPQLAGLARSGPRSLSSKYAIKNIREAQAFLRDPVLGGHLREYTRAVLQLLNPGGGGGRNVDMYAQLVRILGSTDAMKFISSMTLFLEAAEKNGNAADQRLFGAVIQQIGPPRAPDQMTLALLKSSSDAQQPPQWFRDDVARDRAARERRRRLGGGTRRRRRNRRKRKKTRRHLLQRKKQKTRRRKKRYYSRRRLK